MIDRQDIDALLIGALYGELTPADEARLSAHLESHPADKSALADLTSARNAVRESRFLTVQLEPPQAVSALLLQEASRRAKPVPVAAKEKSESWFVRFVNSFARHPAMAAAAMLVVVIGVAGAMYMRNGAQSAERTTETFAEGSPALAPAMEPSRGRAEEDALQLRRNAGSAFQADLAEGGDKASDTGKGDQVARSADDGVKTGAADSKALEQRAPTPTPRTYLGTESKPTPKPMDIDEKKRELSKETAPKGNAKLEATDSERSKPSFGAGGQTRTPPGVVVVPAPDPAPPNAQPPKTVQRSDDSRDGKVDKDQQADPETTWAREQHGKVAAAVKANNCKEASQLALALFNRAPAYYNANVESDRQLKTCMQYITAEREREVERTQRARANQRRNMEEVRDRPAKSPMPDTKTHR